MDPFSEILSLLKPAGHGFRGLNAGPDWSLSFGAWNGLKCYAVAEGHCFLWVDGETGPARLTKGDIVLLPRAHAYRLGSGTKAATRDALSVMSAVPPGDCVVIDGGGTCFGIGGYFAFRNPQADLLLSGLPPMIVLRGARVSPILVALIERLMAELREAQPGGDLLAEHLAQMLLVEALRAHMRDSQGDAGWMLALADRQIARALAAIHAEPARGWTLASMGVEAGMSRSAFAARFRMLAGEPPMGYLTRWRMMLAAERLTTTRLPTGAIAREVGYESESAFSVAFRRVMKMSPRSFRGDAQNSLHRSEGGRRAPVVEDGRQ
jgi:AraC-like DNA-binding protein